MNETLTRNFENRIEELTAIFGRPPWTDEALPDFEAADTGVLQAFSAAYHRVVEPEEHWLRELDRELERYRIQCAGVTQ